MITALVALGVWFVLSVPFGIMVGTILKRIDEMDLH